MSSAPAITIRPLRERDAEFVLELSRHAFAEFSRNPAGPTLWMAEHFTAFVAERETANEGVAPEREGAGPIGFAVVHTAHADARAELVAIAVRERERGRGVGRLLLRAAEREARRKGCVGMVLHTADANLAAIELFLRAGFCIVRRLPRYYRGMYDACEMTKTW